MNQIILASIPAVIALSGVIFITRYNFKKPYFSKVVESQLVNIYVPLHILLEEPILNLSPETYNEETALSYIPKIREVLYDNYALVPPNLMELFHSLNGNISYKNLKTFSATINANFNYCRKMLSYPCDGIGGTFHYLDQKSKFRLILSLVQSALVLLLIFAFCLVYILDYLSSKSTISLALAVFYFIFLVVAAIALSKAEWR